MSSLDPGKAGRAAQRSSRAQNREIERQKKIEELKIAEEGDVIGRKKILAKKGGRSMLVATSPTGGTSAGVNTTLGGGS